jgi:hypothetical protein
MAMGMCVCDCAFGCHDLSENNIKGYARTRSRRGDTTERNMTEFSV